MNISCLTLLSINAQKATSTVDFFKSQTPKKKVGTSAMYLLFGLGGSASAWGLKRRPMSGFRKDMVAGLGVGLLSLDDLGRRGGWCGQMRVSRQTGRAVEGR